MEGTFRGVEPPKRWVQTFENHVQTLEFEDLSRRRSSLRTDEVIKAQDRHLKDVVAQGDSAHEQALKQMRSGWKHRVSGTGWYRKAKRDFAALPEN